MEARFGSEVASVVEVAIQATVSVFRDVWAKEAPNTQWEEATVGEIQEIEKSLVVQIHKVFTEFSSELFEENEALRAKVEQLEDVLQKKAGQLEQELEARVGQLVREMEQLEKELRSIGEGGNKTQGGPTHVLVQDCSLIASHHSVTSAPVLSSSTGPAAPLVSAKESTSNPVTAGSPEAVPSPTAGSVTVPKPATAPTVFGDGPAPTVPLVGVGQVVAPPPVSAASTPQGAPSPDSSTASGVDSAQEKNL